MYWTNQGSILFRGELYEKVRLDGMIVSAGSCILSSNIGKSDTIAICMERSVWALATIFALLRQGIPFVLVDMTLPKKRRDCMLEQLNVRYVITDEKLRASFSQETVFTAADFAGESGGENMTGSTERSTNEDTAYLLYTSGSTGAPKAVEVSQGGLRNLIAGIVERIPFKAGGRMLCLTSMSFDIFFLESVLAMKTGLQVVLASEEERKNPRLTIELIKKYRIENVQITPSHLQMLCVCDKRLLFLQHVRRLLVGGEAFPENLLKELQIHTQCRIYNMYGPTETTVWSSVAELTEADTVHIGTPILNTQFYILDEAHMPVADEEAGELCIAGAGLAKGYRGDEKLTGERFVSAPFEKDLRLYCTGDMAVRKNGRFFYIGRLDNQVKYRGHRIELEEIDACCSRIEDVARSLTYLEEADAESYLLTIYEGSASAEAIRRALAKELAEYMLPKRFIQAEHLLLTANGKVDRSKNREAYVKGAAGIGTLVCKKGNTDVEETVLRLLQTHVSEGSMEMSLDSTLEELYIDSLDFVAIVVEAEEQYGICFEDEMLLPDRFESVRELTAYITALREKREGDGGCS